MQQCIIVLGMHRSGTSAVTGYLTKLGISLGSKLLLPDEYNTKGYFENDYIVKANDHILQTLGSSWDDLFLFEDEWWHRPQLIPHKDALKKILRQEFSASQLFCMKDPRISILLPFWISILRELNIEPFFIIPLRHPLEVAVSLKTRDGFSIDKGVLLWMNNMLSIEYYSRPLRRIFLIYDDFLKCPIDTVQHIFNQFNIDFPNAGSPPDVVAKELLDPKLKHHNLTELNVTRESLPLIDRFYAILLHAHNRAEMEENDLTEKDKIRTEYQRLSSLFYNQDIRNVSLSLKEISANLNQAMAEKDNRMASLNQQLKQREAIVQLMQNSASWRLTKPMRFLARVYRYGFLKEDKQRLAEFIRNRYHRLPLPTPARRAIRFVYHRVLGKTIRALRRFAIRRSPFHAPMIKPANNNRGMSDYIIWGVIDWHFRHQRPQQLALALAAAGRRVFYVSANFVDDDRGGFEVESLDASGRLFQLRLFVKGAPAIYSKVPSMEIIHQLRAGIGEVMDWADCRQIISLVQHPFWCEAASVLPNSRVVYDCMDHHAGFGNSGEALVQLEKELLAKADLTITTSSWLNQTVAGNTTRHALIRNAAEHAHFSQAPESMYRDSLGRRIVGYYGAIAEWFDLDLVEAVAKHRPDCCILLIGADTVNAKSRLGKIPNIKFIGEVSYNELPSYLHSFDVCILPFKITPLTLATNPVKAYEYLSAGKPIVTAALPEMNQFDGLVYVAADQGQFLNALDQVLVNPEPEDLIQRRKVFAESQTWRHRAEELIEHAESNFSDPKVSIIVVTYNNLELSQACLASIDEHSQYSNMEIIVVDNASSDGTPEFLETWASTGANRKIILNDDNRGFAAANNQGLKISSGDFLVLLNNDTYVTPGWVRTMLGHLKRDKSIGLIGPVTNNIGNEARIDITYADMHEMLIKSAAYTRRHIGQLYPIRTAAFFCVMMSKTTFEQVGMLDEAFKTGFFEDDDYCRRIEKLGLGVVCAEDVFIHHHLSAAFDKMKTNERQALFEQNKAVYEAKWGPWTLHAYRKNKQTEIPDRSVSGEFVDQQYLVGRCNVCGKATRFFYKEEASWRESLNCEHCRTTSRYRSITRGILCAIAVLSGQEAQSLADLPIGVTKQLRVYDTQPPFYYGSCAYPLPDLLKATGWIEVELSQYKPNKPMGKVLSRGITNQNLECLTFADESFDMVITSDVMEHVRLDGHAHREIYRVLKPGGFYIFTVPHSRVWDATLIRVQVADPDDPLQDIHLLEPEYHGDANNDKGGGALAYRTYGRDIDAVLSNLGFEVKYFCEDIQHLGILKSELFFCRKKPVDA